MQSKREDLIKKNLPTIQKVTISNDTTLSIEKLIGFENELQLSYLEILKLY